MTIVLSGDKTQRELYEIADRTVQDGIESVSGVGVVAITGGQKRAINVWFDANRLAAYRIAAVRARDAVARQNSDIPGGRVDEGFRELTLRTFGRFPDPISCLPCALAWHPPPSEPLQHNDTENTESSL